MSKRKTNQKIIDRDERALQWIRNAVEQQGRFPTVRALQQAMGLSSTSQAAALLERLEAQGSIERDGLAGAKGSVPVAVLGTIAAGVPLLAAEQIEGYLPVDPAIARGRSLFALKVRGESMINAGILDGDIVIVHRTPVADNGDIVVAMIEDEATVKRFYKEDGHFRLQPENDSFEPIIADEVVLLGKVVALYRTFG